MENTTILFRSIRSVSMEPTRFSIEGSGNWDLVIPPTVYPPREDTFMLCRAITKLSSNEADLALEIGCGSGLATIVLANQGWKVTACDVNPFAVSSTRGNLDLNGIEGKEMVFESGIGEGMEIPEDTRLIVWNLPYLYGEDENRGVLEEIEEVAFNDIADSGWGGALLRKIVDEHPSLCNTVVVILVMRTDPEGASRVSDWEKEGWSWRSLEAGRFGDEKVEVIGFWRTGSGVEPKILESCSSTMDEAAKMSGSGWQRVVSKIQTNGRGRRGSEWVSEEGGVFATWNLDPGILDTIYPGLIQTSVGAAVSEILDAEMKWPNDIIMRNGEKIGGVLLESDNGGPIKVGVGLNKFTFRRGGLSGSGWEETLGESEALEIFAEIDASLSSKFEDNGVLNQVEVGSLVTSSWTALSRNLSRGVAASSERGLLRPIGLNTRGELEVIRENDIEAIRDLDDIGWVFPDR